MSLLDQKIIYGMFEKIELVELISGNGASSEERRLDSKIFQSQSTYTILDKQILKTQYLISKLQKRSYLSTFIQSFYVITENQIFLCKTNQKLLIFEQKYDTNIGKISNKLKKFLHRNQQVNTQNSHILKRLYQHLKQVEMVAYHTKNQTIEILYLSKTRWRSNVLQSSIGSIDKILVKNNRFFVRRQWEICRAAGMNQVQLAYQENEKPPFQDQQIFFNNDSAITCDIHNYGEIEQKLKSSLLNRRFIIGLLDEVKRKPPLVFLNDALCEIDKNK